MHEDLEKAWGSKLPHASDKGYPAIFDEMVFWVLSCGNKTIAYTGSLLSPNGRYALVGNTYVHKEWRNKGLHSHLLNDIMTLDEYNNIYLDHQQIWRLN